MNTPFADLRGELQALGSEIDRRVQFMEVCGTHTVSFFRSGVRSLLPKNIRLLSGPGCPVCVTAQRHIDAAIELAGRPGVILATYGDMIRVPGKLGSLEKLRATGADIRVIGSAKNALSIARENPGRSVVFLGVGFETTAPATAATVFEARREGVGNFSVLLCHKLVVPAMLNLLRQGDVAIDGFLCPGHVSVVIGAKAYEPVVRLHGKPCVVTGFEPAQLLTGLIHLLRQIKRGISTLENVYPAVVSNEGNAVALDLMHRVFIKCDAPWREMGTIPDSGLAFASAFAGFDALQRFNIKLGRDHDHPACKCGEVIKGRAEPVDCPLFDRGCTPLTPIGPCMVSGEGTCSAWYKYNRPRLLASAHEVTL